MEKMEKGKISYTQNTLNPCWLFYPLVEDLESKFSLSKKMKQHISDLDYFIIQTIDYSIYQAIKHSIVRTVDSSII